MQMVKNSLLGVVLVWLGILWLMPKQELYFMLEKELEKQDIVLNEQKRDDGVFTLGLEQVSVYVKGIQVATIEELSVFTLLFYTHINIEGMNVDDSLKSMLPQEVTEANIVHSVVVPTQVSVDANGSFGSMVGEVDLLQRKVHLDFVEGTQLEMLKPHLKKDAKGWNYETSF